MLHASGFMFFIISGKFSAIISSNIAFLHSGFSFLFSTPHCKSWLPSALDFTYIQFPSLREKLSSLSHFLSQSHGEALLLAQLGQVPTAKQINCRQRSQLLWELCGWCGGEWGGWGAGGAGEQKKGLLFIAFQILLTLQCWLIRSDL